MEAQLKLWSIRIDHLAARTLQPGVRASFDALIYIDELKALHAIAVAEYEAIRNAAPEKRAELMAGLSGVWDDLGTALKVKRPPT